MNQFAAWVITLCTLAVKWAIPTWVYRWALLGLVVLPLGFGLVLTVV